ncbi:UNVERIFIED_CONTAM: hypothetical protein FKN15_024239 [Acipenser sinensis]
MLLVDVEELELAVEERDDSAGVIIYSTYLTFVIIPAFRGAGGREAVASEPALTPEHALTTEHNTAQRTPHDPPRRRAQFRARRIVV